MFNLLQPVLDSLGREVALISLGLGEQALLAAVLLVQFLDRAGGILGCDFKLFQRRLLLCKVPGDDERWRDQFGLQLFLPIVKSGSSVNLPSLFLTSSRICRAAAQPS